MWGQMSERDYLAELAARIDMRPVTVDVDPDEVRATMYEGRSASGVVTAYVSGALAFSHVEIAHLRTPESLGGEIVEAVNAAMAHAASACEVPGLDAELAARVSQFDAEIDKLDESLSELVDWIDGLHGELGIDPEPGDEQESEQKD